MGRWNHWSRAWGGAGLPGRAGPSRMVFTSRWDRGLEVASTVLGLWQGGPSAGKAGLGGGAPSHDTMGCIVVWDNDRL